MTYSNSSYLLVLDAVEEEDEESLQAVENGEGVGCGDAALVDVEKAHRPGEAKQEHQSHGATDPGTASTKHIRSHIHEVSVYSWRY